jgi:excisionase family DNA binding protein
MDSEPVAPYADALGDRLAVSPKDACRVLDVGLTKLYELLNDGELESYLEGRRRKITTASIRARVRRLVEANQAAA